jgi:hypothetical protein
LLRPPYGEVLGSICGLQRIIRKFFSQVIFFYIGVMRLFRVVSYATYCCACCVFDVLRFFAFTSSAACIASIVPLRIAFFLLDTFHRPFLRRISTNRRTRAHTITPFFKFLFYSINLVNTHDVFVVKVLDDLIVSWPTSSSSTSMLSHSSSSASESKSDIPAGRSLIVLGATIDGETSHSSSSHFSTSGMRGNALQSIHSRGIDCQCVLLV